MLTSPLKSMTISFVLLVLRARLCIVHQAVRFLHLFPVCRFIIVGNKTDNSGIVCELDDMVTIKTGSTVHMSAA